MHRIVTWFQNFALALGGPGLFLIAFLDSSVLSFPEINDLLVVGLTIQHPERMIYYATMATTGSIAGCFFLYYLGRRGGEAFLERRFGAHHVARARRFSQKYGVLAIIIPALLPPPMPFKIFVLIAGIAQVRPLTFGLSIAVGRGIRYYGQGVLALIYGEAAVRWLRTNSARAALILAGVCLVGGLAYILWKKRRARSAGSR